MKIKYTLFIFTLILLKERATSFIKHQWVNNGTYSYTVLRLNQISNGLPSFPLTAGASINTLKPFFFACFPLKCQRNLIALLVFMPCTIAVETSYIIILHPSLVFKELKGFSFYLIHVFVTLVVVVQIHTTKWTGRDVHR